MCRPPARRIVYSSSEPPGTQLVPQAKHLGQRRVAMSTRTMTTSAPRHAGAQALPLPGILQNWMRRRRFHQAQTRAYARFAAEYPLWAASLFDAHFLAHAAAPALAHYAA